RAWLSRLGGFVLDDDELTWPFPAPSERLREHLTRLASLLWRKIKHGELLFYPAPARDSWRYPPRAPVDFRFANLQKLGGRAVDPRDGGLDSLRYYVDQYLSRFGFPHNPGRAALRRDIAAVKRSFDRRRLTRLVRALTPVEPGAPDPAPLELL